MQYVPQLIHINSLHVTRLIERIIIEIETYGEVTKNSVICG